MSIYLGSNIKYLRKINAVNQSDVASLLNKGATTIGNWENGISEPNINELNTLTEYFAISINDLINTDLSKVPPDDTGSAHVRESAGIYGKNYKAVQNYGHNQESKDAVIQAQQITIETLQKALMLAEEQIKLLKKSPF